MNIYNYKIKNRFWISLAILLLSMPALLFFLLSIPFVLELAINFLDDTVFLSIIFYLAVCCGIASWGFLIYMTKHWIYNHKLGRTKPLIASILTTCYLIFICFGNFEIIFYLFLICSPSILFASYLVWWHSSKKYLSKSHDF